MEKNKLIFDFNLEELKLLEKHLVNTNVDINSFNKKEIEDLKSNLLSILGNGFWIPALINKYKSYPKLLETLKLVIPRILSDLVEPRINLLKKEQERIELNQKKYDEYLEREKISKFVYKNKDKFYTNDREFYCLIGIIESGHVNWSNLKDYCLNETFLIPNKP